jgi:DNA-3-methyladenine glycosylase II
VGPCGLTTFALRPPYESLMRAIAHQQLNGTAAETILRRFIELYPGKPFPTPEEVVATPVLSLRAVGFSNAKVLALHDIAQKTLDGVVPTTKEILALDDEAIVTRLTQVRGVGRWTVEMLLIFQLGRPDVLPIDDFGILSGFKALKRLADMPHRRDLLAHGERWRPHRTVASWYLWRAAELAKISAKKKAQPKSGVSAQRDPRPASRARRPPPRTPRPG